MTEAPRAAAHMFRLAAAVMVEMHNHRIPPSPRAYEVWFTARGGTNPALTRRLDAVLKGPSSPTVPAIDELHAEFIAGPEPDVELMSHESEALLDAAETLEKQVASNQADTRGYGDTLAHWAQHIGDDPSFAVLVEAIASLTAETTKAVERNRTLEQQLAQSVSRVGKLRKSLGEMKQEATTDALTGLCNRRAFDARLKRIMSQARSEPDGEPVSLLLLDVDHFKRFNDTYGHRVGDLVLRLVARLLSENVKGRDTVARHGGEEFAILLTGATAAAAVSVAQQLCTALASKSLVVKDKAHGSGAVTVSIGVAQVQPGETASALLERADHALYQAKRDGRNRVSLALERVVEAA